MSAARITNQRPSSRRDVRVVGALLVLALLVACDGGNFSFAPVTVSGTTQLRADTSIPFTLSGSGFDQGMGTGTITFRALSGTPFAGGTADEVDVIGTVSSDTQISGLTPPALISGTAAVEIVVTAPAGVASMPFLAQLEAPLIWGLGNWGGADWE